MIDERDLGRLITQTLEREAALVASSPPPVEVLDRTPRSVAIDESGRRTLLAAAVLILIAVGVMSVWLAGPGRPQTTIDQVTPRVDATPIPRLVIDLPDWERTSFFEGFGEAEQLVLVDRSARYGGSFVRITTSGSGGAGRYVSIGGRPGRLVEGDGIHVVGWTTPSGAEATASAERIDTGLLLTALGGIDVDDGKVVVSDPTALGDLTVAPPEDDPLLRYVAVYQFHDRAASEFAADVEVRVMAGPAGLSFPYDDVAGPGDIETFDAGGQQIRWTSRGDGHGTRFSFQRGFWAVTVVDWRTDEDGRPMTDDPEEIVRLVDAITDVDDEQFVADPTLVPPEDFDATVRQLVSQLPTVPGFTFDPDAVDSEIDTAVINDRYRLARTIADQAGCDWIQIATSSDDPVAVEAALRAAGEVFGWTELADRDVVTFGYAAFADRVAQEGLTDEVRAAFADELRLRGPYCPY